MPDLRRALDTWRAAPPGDRLPRLRRRARSELRTRWFRRRLARVELGRGVLVQGPLRITGPGRVVFGDGCRIDGVDVQTHSPDAVVAFGRDCYVNFPEIRSATSVTFGDRCIVGSALVLDTDFHPLPVADRHRPGAPVRSLPITVEDDVWIGARTSVLPGVTIGAGAVVALGTVVHGDVPPAVVVGPSPMRVLRDVPSAEEPEDRVRRDAALPQHHDAVG